MLDFDQLFKKLLISFFGDLLSLVRPTLLAQTKLELTTFEDKELFSDLRQGKKRLADVVAKLSLKDAASTLVLAHVEVESAAAADIGTRMYAYNMSLQLREQLPVFPLVIYLSGGTAGVTWNIHQVKVLQDVICEFRYLSLGLSKWDAEALLKREEPLAWALAAFAKTRSGRARLKLECLRRIARAGLDQVRQFLLVDAVETRLQLRERDQQEYQRLLASEAAQEVVQMELTWSAQIEQRAERVGEKNGRRALVQRLLLKRFGALPAESLQKLAAITSEEELDTLGEQLLTAGSLEELGLT